MHPDEIETSAGLVRRLLAAQFPRWSELPIALVESYGTDHDIYRLGDHLAARLPRIGWATEQAANLLADEEFRAGLEARIPLHRIADTDDVVGASLLLCTEAASFITGQILTLDGGLTACQ